MISKPDKNETNLFQIVKGHKMKTLKKIFTYRMAKLFIVLAIASFFIGIILGIVSGAVIYDTRPVKNEFGQVVGAEFIFNRPQMFEVWFYGVLSTVFFTLVAIGVQLVHNRMSKNISQIEEG
jgi:hypothetical protein